MAALTSNMVPQPHHFSRQNLESTDGSVSMDSSDHFDRESPNIDHNSCSSDDTVLSVGNENPPPEDTPLSFKNIESHLNAISQITNSTLDPGRKSPSSPRISSPSSTKSGSPGFLTYTKADRDVDLFRGSSTPESPEHYYNQKTLQANNNDASNGNLKFSIDNILKADFGRRITDPINIRKCKPKKVVPEVGGVEEAKGPVDLSKSEPEKKTESQPMLWPAWVYCTRYSDRPSSGRSKLSETHIPIGKKHLFYTFISITKFRRQKHAVREPGESRNPGPSRGRPPPRKSGPGRPFQGRS
ncbi:engrailed isoform X2 [Tribolium castaneum]|uniref:engrailed isoform X2 n=1 Tax=Tribolium castaneum TaxID=7070 RepID=UPI0030FE01A2